MAHEAMAEPDIPALHKALDNLHLSPANSDQGLRPWVKPLDLYRHYLAEILATAAECSQEVAIKSIQWPNNSYNGDLAVILPKLCHGAKLDELGIDLKTKWPVPHPLFPLPISEGVHLRIFFDPKTLARLLLPYILQLRSTYGNDSSIGLSVSPSPTNQKVVVEFSSPNTPGDFQGYHLRSTILGAFVSRLYQDMGWDVVRVNYLGDFGKHFALLIVGWERYGNEEAYEADPVSHLHDVYHKINEDFQPEEAARRAARDEAVRNGQDEGEATMQIESQGLFAERNAAFTKLESGDEATVAFWKRAIEAYTQSYANFYARLGITFDHYSGESEVKSSTMTEIEELLKDKGICEQSGDTWIIHMKNLGLRAGTAIIRDHTGATTYLLRDLAAVLERFRKFEFDKMIYIVASNNTSHFSYVKKILEALDMKDLADKLLHFKFSEASKMADKLGDGYKPQTVLDYCEQAVQAALLGNEKLSILGNDPESISNLAVSALVAQELGTRTGTAHAFDSASMTTIKPGTGLGLQYCHARLCLLLKEHPGNVELSDDDYEVFTGDDAAHLLRILIQYPEVTHAAYTSLEPATVITYLTNLSEQLAECLEAGKEEEEDGKGEEEDQGTNDSPEEPEKSVAPGLAVLYEAARIVLENGMRLLGLRPVGLVGQNRADTPVAE